MSSNRVGAMTFGDHLCLPYDNDDERNAILLDYIGDGLRSDHKVVYLSAGVAAGDGAGSGIDGLLGRMTYGTDDAAALSAALAAGQLETGPWDADEAAVLVGTAAGLARAQGYGGVRIIREPDAAGASGCGLERAFADPGVQAMAVCQYDRRWFAAAQVERLEACHDGRVVVNALHDDGVLVITPLYAPPGLRLAGAIDESTLPALRSALLGARRGPHLCLDLSRLDFCDMEGLELLVAAGRGGGVGGMERQVVLRGVPGYLDLMMRISGWEAVPGVFVEEAAR
ncbi:MEDS domain-containing protein [Spirillospora sp. NPDC047279]|uniref:MEDS domain-containing protein n=1 Tax=Spirillospora sp. NPDC047279 TaxID=3155478 RepID=UPI0033D180E9